MIRWPTANGTSHSQSSCVGSSQTNEWISVNPADKLARRDTDPSGDRPWRGSRASFCCSQLLSRQERNYFNNFTSWRALHLLLGMEWELSNPPYKRPAVNKLKVHINYPCFLLDWIGLKRRHFWTKSLGPSDQDREPLCPFAWVKLSTAPLMLRRIALKQLKYAKKSELTTQIANRNTTYNVSN